MHHCGLLVECQLTEGKDEGSSPASGKHFLAKLSRERQTQEYVDYKHAFNPIGRAIFMCLCKF